MRFNQEPNSVNISFEDFAVLCSNRSSGYITAAEAASLYEMHGLGSSADSTQAIGAVTRTIDDLMQRSEDFFVHPITFRQLKSSKLAHHEWIKAKKSTNQLIPMGLSAMANPFYTEYLVDVCEMRAGDAMEELMRQYIVEPSTLEFTSLLSPQCSFGDVEKASKHIEKWWATLSEDGLDSSQIIRTICGERRKNPEGTILIGQLAMNLLTKDTSTTDEMSRILERPPSQGAPQDEILDWVRTIGSLEGRRQTLEELASEID